MHYGKCVVRSLHTVVLCKEIHKNKFLLIRRIKVVGDLQPQVFISVGNGITKM